MAGLALAGFLVLAGEVSGAWTAVMAGAAGLLVISITAASPLRTFCFAIALQIVLSVSELEYAGLAFSNYIVRPDEILLAWFVLLWLVFSADRKVPAPRGAIPVLIAVFLLLCTGSVLRGAGIWDPVDIWNLRNYFGYFFFFPAWWLGADPADRERIWKVLLAVSVVAGFVFFLKAVTGLGENLYYLSSGVRIQSRQPNAYGAVMLMLIARIWKSPEKPPLLLSIPAIVLMGGGVLLSQTRGLWAAILISLLAAWLLGLFRRERERAIAGQLVKSILLIALAVVLAIAAVSATGALSTSQLGQRLGGEYSEYAMDASVLSRFLAWAAVLDLLRGPALVYGMGMGATYTFYRPEHHVVGTIYYVDGSIWQALLNMGVLGAGALVLLFAVAIISAARLFLVTIDQGRAARALGIFCALLMAFIASMGMSVITNYSYTVLWAVLMAFLCLEWREERLARA
jgi:hypothetical protein